MVAPPTRMPYGPDNPLAILKYGSDLMTWDFPAVKWAIPGIIPEGYTVLSGAPKVGKSWFALDTCKAVAGGTNALGVIPTGDARPVLYLALEDNDRRMQRRLSLLGGKVPPLFTYQTGAEVPDAYALDVAAAWLNEHAHDEPVVFVDTLGRILRAAMPGQGAYERDYALGSKLKALAELAPGSAVVAVHHTRKMIADNDWTEAVSGTNGVVGAADSVIVMARQRGEGAARLSVTGRDIDEDGTMALCRDELSNGLRWVLDGNSVTEAMQRAEQAEQAASDTSTLGDLSHRILRHLGDHPGIGPTAVAVGIGQDADAVRQTIQRLYDKGRLTKVGRGSYHLAVSQPSQPSQTHDDLRCRSGQQCDGCDGCDTQDGQGGLI